MYYLSHVVSSGYSNWNNIEKEIYSRDIYLSQWSLVELITTDKLRSEEKDRVYQFIADNKLRVIPIGIQNKFTELVPLDLSILSKSISKDQILEMILGEKKEKETQLLRYTLIVGVNLFYFALYLKLVDENASEEALSAFSFLCYHLLTGNFEYLLDSGEAIIEEKYAGDKDSINGSKIFGLLNTLIFTISIYHDMTIKGKPFDIFPDLKSRFTTDQLAKVKNQIAAAELMNVLLDRLNEIEITSLKKVIPEKYFETAMKETIIALSDTIPIGILNFSMYLVQKSFFEARKPLKNDMIDGQLFELYPEFQIITFDKKMKAVIEKFDKTMLGDNNNLLKL